tara:strand:+ start:268 stop:489 length:222 start_codon:yes stop_codon:yes gene_type:complete
MKKNNKNIRKYLKIIDKVEKIRSKNNVNWMDILRLAFKHNPIAASKLMKKVNSQDGQISKELKKLSIKKKTNF